MEQTSFLKKPNKFTLKPEYRALVKVLFKSNAAFDEWLDQLEWSQKLYADMAENKGEAPYKNYALIPKVDCRLDTDVSITFNFDHFDIN